MKVPTQPEGALPLRGSPVSPVLRVAPEVSNHSSCRVDGMSPVTMSRDALASLCRQSPSPP